MAEKKPIRVLQVLPSMGHGGIEHFLMNLYRAIDRSKVQFDFMYRVPYECVFDGEIKSLGGRIYRFVDPDRHPLSSGRFYRNFFAEHPEFKAIHEHRSGCDGFFGLMHEAKRAGVPLRILHSHSSQKGWTGNPVKELSDAYNAARLDTFANVFIACSDAAAEHLYGRCKRAASECIICPNAIDLDAFSFDVRKRDVLRNRYEIAEDSLVVGHVGRFAPEKNQGFLVDVIRRLRSEDVSVDALLLGDGPLRDEVEQKAISFGVAQYVHFVGIQDNPAPYYSAMDVYCMPSIFEGLPVSCIEAQANGLPMVLSNGISKMANVCGCTKFLDLATGAPAWAEALLLSGANARRDNRSMLVSAGYDISEVAKKYVTLYQNGLFS